MISVFLCLILIASTTLIGNSFSQRLQNRCKCLGGLVQALTKMRSLIIFSGYDIRTVVKDGFSNIEGFESFCDIAASDEAFDEWWNKKIHSIDKYKGLLKEDIEILLRFGEGLGISDIQGQDAHFQLYSDLILQKLQQAKENVNQKSRLYRILGFSMGCAVTLIIL